MGFIDTDLAYPSLREERQKHKRKRLVQGPNAYFMDVRCPQCKCITVVYSHASSQVVCNSNKCGRLLSKPTGGKARLVHGCLYRRKPNF